MKRLLISAAVLIAAAAVLAEPQQFPPAGTDGAIGGGGPKPAEGLSRGLLVYYSLDGASATRADSANYVGYDNKGPGYAGHTLYPSADTASFICQQYSDATKRGRCLSASDMYPVGTNSELHYTAGDGGSLAPLQFSGDMSASIWIVGNAGQNVSSSGFVGSWLFTVPASALGNTYLLFTTGAGPQSIEYPDDAKPPFGRRPWWQHYAFTYKESTKVVQLWFNGTKVVPATVVPQNRSTTVSNLLVAKQGLYMEAGPFFDELAVWTRVLDDSEMQQLYNWRSPSPGGQALPYGAH